MAELVIPWRRQARQMTFLRACGLSHPWEGGGPRPAVADVIGYGGAAGGGKSDALLMAGIVAGLSYPGCKVAYFRRKGVELEGLGGAVMRSRELLSSWCKWNGKTMRWALPTGSMIQFCHCNEESDVHQYQSQQFDLLLFDEATQFTHFQYRYLISRNRATVPGIRPFTAVATNPGGIGHAWFKREFVDPGPPERVHEVWIEGKPERHIFIPAYLDDNAALVERDPGYRERLDRLPEVERRQLLYGDWDAFGGQYYPEWDRRLHVVTPEAMPLEPWYKRFRSLDYGLDMTACHWWAVRGDGSCVIYRELYEPDLRLSQAAEAIMDLSPRDERVSYTVAAPDLWNRRQDTGKSGQEVLAAHGLKGLVRADNRRVPGWRVLREYLAPYEDEQGQPAARLRVYNTCTNIIRCLPLLQRDDRDPEDAADTPHEITHAPESVRYGVMSRPPLRSEDPSSREAMVRRRRQRHAAQPINRHTGY